MIAQTSSTTWLDLVERFGVSVFLVLFMCAIVWRLLPYLVEWFKTSTKQSEVIIEAIPDIRESMKLMAHNNEDKLNCIEARTQRLEETTDQILEKISKG